LSENAAPNRLLLSILHFISHRLSCTARKSSIRSLLSLPVTLFVYIILLQLPEQAQTNVQRTYTWNISNKYKSGK
jgi:hypothetical protein